jgi:hypothetical protein
MFPFSKLPQPPIPMVKLLALLGAAATLNSKLNHAFLAANPATFLSTKFTTASLLFSLQRAANQVHPFHPWANSSATLLILLAGNIISAKSISSHEILREFLDAETSLPVSVYLPLPICVRNMFLRALHTGSLFTVAHSRMHSPLARGCCCPQLQHPAIIQHSEQSRAWK